MVKTTLSQMSFHDRGFHSRDGFDSQSSRVPVLSYDRGNDGRCLYIRSIKMCLARSNIRERGHRIQPPGVTQRDAHDVRALPGRELHQRAPRQLKDGDKSPEQQTGEDWDQQHLFEGIGIL